MLSFAMFKVYITEKNVYFSDIIHAVLVLIFADIIPLISNIVALLISRYVVKTIDFVAKLCHL